MKISTWAVGRKWQPEVKCPQWSLPKFWFQVLYILIPMRKYQPLVYFTTLPGCLKVAPISNRCFTSPFHMPFILTTSELKNYHYHQCAANEETETQKANDLLRASQIGNDQVKAQTQIILLQVIHKCTLQIPSTVPGVGCPKVSNSYPLL